MLATWENAKNAEAQAWISVLTFPLASLTKEAEMLVSKYWLNTYEPGTESVSHNMLL